MGTFICDSCSLRPAIKLFNQPYSKVKLMLCKQCFDEHTIFNKIETKLLKKISKRIIKDCDRLIYNK